ncbi:MAG: ABC transporter ATP-binding protein/permease [Clostridium sp.]|jgi:ATP-binding cassette subfamily B protein|uniref:ABC transporter ATP-binding protein n=1 Tax=Clostridium sp. TaxID=1506 RepID=UPI0025BE0580|nr:ABC transporter ATP-binding protein [Clostridium sp.]MCH3964484.1 ABC transporter ATP-binding protein/permease [Clostridium sp.]MCI1714956.1 ABC transporter ATP-binding protein/permease [Clostridium sp.]MCI1799218.1 ABC transporter ATP-binding protein/permease [Clostridium sp.]MCI1813139.1 ABC transporter ATP-binding protein/permease [Clostridium sp.]MCI1870029.1 ABC transporter ATP-binding protein/permease [Clostridium sp.]
MQNKKHNVISGIISFADGYKKQMSLSAILSIFSVAAGFFPYVMTAKILSDMILSTATIHDILLCSVLITAGYLLKIVFYNLATALSHKSTYEILKNIRIAIVEKLSRISMGDLQSQISGDYKQLIMDDVEKLEYPLAHAIPEIISNALAPIIVIVYLLTIDYRMAIAGLISIFIGILIIAMMMKGGAMKVFKEYNSGSALLNSTTIEYVNGMEVVKAFNQTASSMEKFKYAVNNFRDVMTKWFAHCWPYLSGYNVIMPASIAFVLPIGSVLYQHGVINISDFIMCMVLSLGIAPPLMKLVEFTDNLPTIMFMENKVYDILSKNELEQPLNEASICSNEVVFQNVTFGYEKKEVLHSISFLVKPNATTALVGPSGSGKSTIAKLIARFWDVNGGSILIGSVNVNTIPIKQLMDNISFVSQDNYLFDVSIRENIRLGNFQATDKEVEEAAEKAECTEFISRFSEGYDTRVGDAGNRLSGGERQRIAIARAILKDAPIIVLDEATAFVDAESEDKIQHSIDNLTKNKTLIIIAHRLATIVNSDNIVVLENGNIVSQGTHGELLKKSELYNSMWQSHIGARSWSMNEGGKTICGK